MLSAWNSFVPCPSRNALPHLASAGRDAAEDDGHPRIRAARGDAQVCLNRPEPRRVCDGGDGLPRVHVARQGSDEHVRLAGERRRDKERDEAPKNSVSCENGTRGVVGGTSVVKHKTDTRFLLEWYAISEFKLRHAGRHLIRTNKKFRFSPPFDFYGRKSRDGRLSLRHVTHEYAMPVLSRFSLRTGTSTFLTVWNFCI